MKKISIALLCLLAFSKLSWTQEEKIIELTTSASLMNMEKVPFNSVVVLDHRSDTSQLGLLLVGIPSKLVPLYFNTGASNAISHCISSSISKFPAEPRKLIVDLKKLMAFEKAVPNYEKGIVEFSADAYIQQDNGLYAKVYSHDTLVIVVGADVTNTVMRTIPGLIDHMVENICTATEPPVNTSYLASVDEILLGVRKYWAQYPVNRSAKHAKGIYNTFRDFRENRIDTTTQVAMIMQDGIYKVYHLLKKGRPDIKRPITGIWGICDGNKLYYRLNEVFVPMVNRNNTFYFLASIENFYKHNDPKGGEIHKLTTCNMARILPPYNELYSSMSGLMVDALEHRDRKLRFYIDMDSGKVIEYTPPRNMPKHIVPGQAR